MKSTGIVRRIDELGRVVIPKEIRKTMRMREGEEVEVFTTDSDELVIKKYSPITGLLEVSARYAETINKIYGFTVAVFDRDKVVAVEGRKFDIKCGNRLSVYAEGLIEGRRAMLLNGETREICGEVITDSFNAAFAPILKSGDVSGGITLYSASELNEGALRLAETISELIATQI